MCLKMISKLKFLHFISLLALIGFSLNSLYAMEDGDIEELIDALSQKVKVSHSLTLSRWSGDDSELVQYTQKLTSHGKELNLSRTETSEFIDHVRTASLEDDFVTHLLAQGICQDSDTTWSKICKTTLGFPDIEPSHEKIVDWVSQKSAAKTTDDYYIRTPQGSYGGHAESQLMSDILALFERDSDTIVTLLTPPSESAKEVYMCGLEIFGPYDMCDKYDSRRSNQYDCVGTLKNVRDYHQREGQQTISQAIRNKLGSRFKGNPEEAFVVIYHAYSPYHNVYTYKAEDKQHYYPLSFEFNGCQFLCEENFDDSYNLSQRVNIKAKPDVLYGYIHQLGDKKVNYNPGTQRFSFP